MELQAGYALAQAPSVVAGREYLQPRINEHGIGFLARCVIAQKLLILLRFNKLLPDALLRMLPVRCLADCRQSSGGSVSFSSS